MELILTVRYLDDLAGLGVDVPTKALAGRDIYEQAVATAARQPIDALAAKLDAGKVTAKNVGDLILSAAAELTAQQSAHQIVRGLEYRLNRSIREALREHTPQIVADLRATFQPAAEAVMDAAKRFGPDTTAEEVVSMEPETVKLWNQLAGHCSTLATVSSTYRTLLADVRYELPEHVATLFVTEATDLGVLDQLSCSPNPWLTLAHAGHTLTLNTPEEAAAVVAKVEQAQAKAAAEKREADLAAHRRRHMPMRVPSGKL